MANKLAGFALRPQTKERKEIPKEAGVLDGSMIVNQALQQGVKSRSKFCQVTPPVTFQ